MAPPACPAGFRPVRQSAPQDLAQVQACAAGVYQTCKVCPAPGPPPTPAPPTPAPPTPAPPTPAPPTPAPPTPAPGPPSPAPAPGTSTITGCSKASGGQWKWAEGIDLAKGHATFTRYQLDPGAGTFSVNKNLTSFGANWIGMAAPYSWFRPTVGAAQGACTGGIQAGNGRFPTLGGQPMCFKLTNKANNNTANGVVVETCGGNCCVPSVAGGDCALFGNNKQQLSKTNCYGKPIVEPPPMQYQIDMRDRPSQTQQKYPDVTRSSTNQNFEYNNNTFFTGTAQTDWCSGAFVHFDLDVATSGGFRGGQDTGEMEFERIPCPDLSFLRHDGCCESQGALDVSEFCNSSEDSCAKCSGTWHAKCPFAQDT